MVVGVLSLLMSRLTGSISIFNTASNSLALRPLPPLIRFTVKESVLCSSPQWETWRNEQDKDRSIGGNSFAQMCGHGYESASEAYKKFFQLQRLPPKQWRDAMDHGKNNEHLVKSALMVADSLSLGFLQDPCSTKYEVHVRVPDGRTVDFHAITSPDMCVEFTNELYEIKCPFYRMKDFTSPIAFRQWWLSKQTASHGKTQYFLQILWYWYFVAQCTAIEFHVVVAFFGFDDTFCYSKYTFDMAKQENSEMASEFVASMLLKIASFTPETFPKRMTKAEKEKADLVANTCFASRFDSELFYYKNGQLYEYPEEYAWDYTDGVPWNESLAQALSAAV